MSWVGGMHFLPLLVKVLKGGIAEQAYRLSFEKLLVLSQHWKVREDLQHKFIQM